jgi:iron complex outermembrane receptor protein
MTMPCPTLSHSRRSTGVLAASLPRRTPLAQALAHALAWGGLGLLSVASPAAQAQTQAQTPQQVPAPVPVQVQADSKLAPVVITGSRGEKTLPRQRSTESDSARLLTDHPGVSLYEAGGVSSLPVIRGLADDRIRLQVDGMDLMAACPNHMNSPLSYIDASQVGRVRVYAGIAPVSEGGDSIAGTIQVESAAARFVADGEPSEVGGRISSFYRSNGQAQGVNVRAERSGDTVALALGGAWARSRNYRAGGDFKAAGPGASGRRWLAADEVGSTAYETSNGDFDLAVRHDGHQLRLQLGRQHIPYELYPNQRMDMTGNDSSQVNLRYAGSYSWGELTARAYQQRVRHVMDMGPDRADYGTGMPMDTRSQTRGAALQGQGEPTSNQTLRLGLEGQSHWLYDWWSPVGTGMMAPRTFWNVDYGTRDRVGAYGDWERRWGDDASLRLGLRHDRISSNAGPVQGYNASPLWADDAAAFNAQARRHSTQHRDFSALGTLRIDPMFGLEGGLARKSRSPNLYERYPWSTQPMATLMNNFVGDGNGYIGNPDLRPEVAHTASLSGDWHDSDSTRWSLRLTGHYTYVQDYIDAERCASAMCGGSANVQNRSGFVNLRYVNQSARLYGLDLSARALLGQSSDWGNFSATALASYLRGVNATTGDGLYHQMPLNLKLGLTQAVGSWSNSAEYRVVASKHAVSEVRNELPTAGYALLTLRSSTEWRSWRLDLAVDNVFDRAYAQPLGGAYAGQGASMSTTSLPWGVTVPGRGRSFDIALTCRL